MIGVDGIDRHALVLAGIIERGRVLELQKPLGQRRRLRPVGTATQHENVGDDLRPGHTTERGGRQPHCPDEVAEGGDVAARPLVLGVQGVAGGQDGDVPAGAVIANDLTMKWLWIECLAWL